MARERSHRKLLIELVDLWDRGLLQMHEFSLERDRKEILELFDEIQRKLKMPKEPRDAD